MSEYQKRRNQLAADKPISSDLAAQRRTLSMNSQEGNQMIQTADQNTVQRVRQVPSEDESSPEALLANTDMLLSPDRDGDEPVQIDSDVAVDPSGRALDSAHEGIDMPRLVETEEQAQ